MKVLQICMLMLLPFVVISQRGDVPTTNPDNTLDLKVVFQEYTVTTTSRYGNTSSKSEYLNLKVNDMYMPNGGTGISEMHFRRYLSDCPKALNLSLDGLSMHDKGRGKANIGKYAMLGGAVVGGYFMFRNTENFDKASVTTGVSIAAGGILTNYIFQRLGKSDRQKGDKIIVSAFDEYAKSCYQPDLNALSPSTEYPEQEDAGNGENNKDENLRIELLSNNADSKFLSVTGKVGISFYDGLALNFGPEITFYKKGLYFNGYAHGSKSIGDDVLAIDNLEYGGSALLTLPFIKSKAKLKKANLSVGKMQGMETLAMVEDSDLQMYKSYGIDLGADYFQQHVSSFSDLNTYFVKSTLFRGGLSYTRFSEVSFKVNDNRFSKDNMYNTVVARFYLNALYNFDTDYQVMPSQFMRGPSLEDEIGLVLGIDLKGSRNKNRAYSFLLEVGKYPVVNDIGSWGGQMKIGYGLYSVDRTKAKSRSRRSSRR